jgi:2-oxoglutarate dehydrogenase E2 component (dihydrolipoamide succinyltransferase)
MSVEIRVPQLGESVVEATVGRWQKGEGERLAEGEALVELETDKVNMEVAAPGSGVLERIVKREGETVGVGEVIGLVSAANGQEPAAPTADTSGRAAPAATVVPAAAAAAAPATPATQGEPPFKPGRASPATAPALAETARATPLARQMAAELGLDLQNIRGTGPGGRITQGDVAAYRTEHPEAPSGSYPNGADASVSVATARAPTPAPPPAPARPAPDVGRAPAAAAPAWVAPQAPPPPVPTLAPAVPPTGGTAAGRTEERVRMSRRRLTIARRLVEAQRTAAMLTTFNEVDMSAILAIRTRRRDAFKERYGVGLGFMSFFTRAVIGALKAYPRLNAELQGDELVLKRYYDIGIAVSTDEGLVVPVMRGADRLSFSAIERAIATLAEKARNRTLGLEELQGGTFTITNGGVFGSLLSTPILNGPQVGILGMHKVQERPVAIDGQVVIHPMMYVALSYDHRIVDGAEAVSFLVRVKELLEDPEALLLEG